MSWVRFPSPAPRLRAGSDQVNSPGRTMRWKSSSKRNNVFCCRAALNAPAIRSEHFQFRAAGVQVRSVCRRCSHPAVIPAKASFLSRHADAKRDSGFRRNDGRRGARTAIRSHLTARCSKCKLKILYLFILMQSRMGNRFTLSLKLL